MKRKKLPAKMARRMKQFGQNVRVARLGRGASQTETASRANITPATLIGIEQGVSNSTFIVKLSLADALETTLEALHAGV